MPISVLIQERKVLLIDDETTSILDCYDEATIAISERAKQKGNRSDVELGNIEAVKGFLAKMILIPIEELSSTKFGGKYRILPERKFELEAIAEMLLRRYLNFLNRTLKKQGIDAKEERGEPKNPLIKSKYVLVYELLYRLVCSSLCNKLDCDHDGEKLISALATFIKKITQKELLLDGMFANRISPFLNSFFSSEHSKWINYIIEMIRFVKLTNSNTRVVSNILAGIRKSEQIIQMHLIAFINKNEDVNDFDPKWLDTSLETCESAYLDPRNELEIKIEKDKKKIKLQPEKENKIENIFLVNLQLTERQKNILKTLNGKSFSKEHCEKIENLYRLLNQNYFLYNMISTVDLLITCMGWMPILGGVIEFDKIKNLIEKYNRHCREILSISEEERKFLNGTSAERALLKYGAITMIEEELNCVVFQSSERLGHSLEELSFFQDDALKERMKNMIVSMISSLLKQQDALPINERFINLKRIETIGLSELGSQEFFHENVEYQDQIREKEEDLSQLRCEVDSAKDTIFELQCELVRNASLVDTLEKENRELHKENKNLREKMYTLLLHKTLINKEGAPAILRLLKEQGADLKAYCEEQGYNGYTALHIAARTGNLAACEWLINEGKISVTILDRYGRNAIEQAEDNEAGRAIIIYLSAQYERQKKLTQLLHEIIRKNNISEHDKEELNRLIADGVDINDEIIEEKTLFQRGDMPLHILLLKGNHELIKWAMTNNANPNLKNRRNQTPGELLQTLSEEKYEPTKRFLEEHYPGQFFSTEPSSRTEPLQSHATPLLIRGLYGKRSKTSEGESSTSSLNSKGKEKEKEKEKEEEKKSKRYTKSSH